MVNGFCKYTSLSDFFNQDLVFFRERPQNIPMQPVCFFFLSAVNVKNFQVFWQSTASVTWNTLRRDPTGNVADSLHWETTKVPP